MRAATSLLRVRQLAHGALEVLLDDALRAAQPLERLDPQDVRARRPLVLPEPLHDDLEVRRLDPRAVLAALDDSEAAERRLDRARPDLVEDSLDEKRLDGDGLARELGVPLDGADDRRAGRLAVEPVEPESVREEAGDPAGEAIELGERVLAQRDEHVHAERSSQHCRKRLGERAGPGVVGVVEEVLLRLVEDEVDVPPVLGALEPRQHGAVGVRTPRRLPQGVGQRRRRILTPAREDDHERILGERPERARDGRAQERRLPDAARAVQHRQARSDEVGGHDLVLALPAEEEQRVELGVLEDVEPLVRRCRRVAPHAASSRRSRSSTYASGSTSSGGDVVSLPERARERARRALHGPRAIGDRPLAPDAG